MKPNYIIIYKNQEKLNNLIEKITYGEAPLRDVRYRDSGYIEYKYFVLRLFKKEIVSENLRGCKAWGVMVEECLYDECKNDDRYWILEYIVNPYSMFGGVKVFY